MKKASLALLVSLFAVAAYAQSEDKGVTMSTDPAKAADVEQRAQALESAQSAVPEQHEATPMKKHHKAPTKHHKAAEPAGASQ